MNKLSFISILGLFYFQIWSSESWVVSEDGISCFQETRKVGVFANDQGEERLCVDIDVPPNRYVRLEILALNFYSLDCSKTTLEIEVKGTNEKYSFCSGDSIKNPVTAVSDARIIFRHVKPFRSYNSRSVTLKPTFRLKFEIKDIECLRSNNFRCSDDSCIPKNEVCDGVEDCENGADEVGCETGIMSIKGVADARLKELKWLLENMRTTSWGWQENTPRVAISLFLTGAVQFNNTNHEQELVAKETKLRTSIALLKNPLPNEQLSIFINSLLVTCHNPRHFYGHNLVKRLKKQVRSSHIYIIHPLAYLTLCNAKESWPPKAFTDLNKLLSSNPDYAFIRDYQAIAVMAVSCYENQTKFLNDTEHDKLRSNYQKVIKLFKESQLSDGSFGNLHTTSLVTQALISSGQEYAKDWKLNATIQYLIQQLSTPHDIIASSLTLPILNAKCLTDIAKINCTSNPRRSGYENLTSEINDYTGPRVRVQYSLFVGDQKDVIHTISLRVPENYTAYEVMKLAEAEDSKYAFKYKKISGTMYVYQISELINDPEGGFFWQLYQGLKSTNTTLSRFTLSPDQLVMQDDEHLVMWYKKAEI